MNEVEKDKGCLFFYLCLFRIMVLVLVFGISIELTMIRHRMDELYEIQKATAKDANASTISRIQPGKSESDLSLLCPRK